MSHQTSEVWNNLPVNILGEVTNFVAFIFFMSIGSSDRKGFGSKSSNNRFLKIRDKLTNVLQCWHSGSTIYTDNANSKSSGYESVSLLWFFIILTFCFQNHEFLVQYGEIGSHIGILKLSSTEHILIHWWVTVLTISHDAGRKLNLPLPQHRWTSSCKGQMWVPRKEWQKHHWLEV